MNLVGKILVVCILVMTVVYMGFAMAVYSNHVNWKTKVENPEAGKDGYALGLKYQLENEQEENKQLKAQLAKFDSQLAQEREAYRQQLAKLEGENARQSQLVADQKTQIDDLTTKNRELVGALDATQDHNTQLVDLTDKLKADIVARMQERDMAFKKLVQATDDLHQKANELKTVKERRDQLTRQIAKYRLALQNHDINPELPLEPPAIDGYILAVQGNNLIEISLGADDGLKSGHTLEIVRGDQYVGRATVMRTASDKSVAKVDIPNSTGQPRKGDRVATKLKVG